MGSADAMVNKTLQYITSVVGGREFIQVLQGSFVSPTDLSRSRAGRVAEWFKAPVLKTGKARKGLREFESHPFRHLDDTQHSAGKCRAFIRVRDAFERLMCQLLMVAVLEFCHWRNLRTEKSVSDRKAS
jgi:hypothetical protein